MKIKLLIVFLAISTISNAQVPAWQWAESAQGGGQDYGQNISTDANGNCYVTGYFDGAVVFGNDTLTASVSYPNVFFIAKYDNLGNELWARSAAGDASQGISICTDANGNSYVTGHFHGAGTITFGNITLITDGTYHIFVVKYDASGNVIWARDAGASMNNQIIIPSDASFDANGNVYVTGEFNDSTILMKYNSAGNVVWKKHAAGQNFWGTGVSTDGSGNSYVTGYFMGASLTFDTTTVTGSNGQIIFVAKYNSAGNLIWAKSGGGVPSVYNPAISIDAAGNSYLTGFFNGATAVFGSTTLYNAGFNDIFIVKYDNSGNVVWAKSAGGPDYDNGTSISTDANGNSYVTGMFKSFANFGGTNLFSAGGNDIFVAKYDNAGNVIWVTGTGGTDSDWGTGISVATNGDCYITGHFFSSDVPFGNFSVINNSSTGNFADIYTAKIGSTVSIPEENNNESALNIFPNPSSGSFYIILQNAIGNGTIEIYNVLGEKIHMEKISFTQSKQVNLKDISSGIYFVKLYDGERSFTKKIIITRD